MPVWLNIFYELFLTNSTTEICVFPRATFPELSKSLPLYFSHEQLQPTLISSFLSNKTLCIFRESISDWTFLTTNLAESSFPLFQRFIQPTSHTPNSDSQWPPNRTKSCSLLPCEESNKLIAVRLYSSKLASLFLLTKFLLLNTKWWWTD